MHAIVCIYLHVNVRFIKCKKHAWTGCLTALTSYMAKNRDFRKWSLDVFRPLLQVQKASACLKHKYNLA